MGKEIGYLSHESLAGLSSKKGRGQAFRILLTKAERGRR